MRCVALQNAPQLGAVLVSGEPISLTLFSFVARRHVAENIVQLALCVDVYGVHDYNFNWRRLLARKAICKTSIRLYCLGAFSWDRPGDGNGRLRGRDICTFRHGVVVEVGCDVASNGFPDV
jgi:hypothetical protein